MRHVNDGLRKRCGCGRKQWARCRHPWHFAFFKKRCACEGDGNTCEHHQQNRVRVSLHKLAEKPTSYSMPKTEAEAWADKLRAQIREGTFGMPEPATTSTIDTRLTVGDVVDQYIARHVRRPGRREAPIKAVLNYLRLARRSDVPGPNSCLVRFESKPIAEVTTPDIEALREARRAQLRQAAEARALALEEGKQPARTVLPGVRAGEIGIEHLMAELRQFFEWSASQGYVTASPFTRNGRQAVKVKTQKKRHRQRRLDAEAHEEERLLAAAEIKGRRAEENTHLRDLIRAALETGCREGELLSLQWWQIRVKHGVMAYIDLPADKTKTNEPRLVPITANLRALLEFRRIGPDGRPQDNEAYVFGNAFGERVGRIYTAWRATCRRAEISDLHFHDLRHEFISRMLDAGVPIHRVRDWAGHSNIATTGIYANTRLEHLDEAKVAFEHARRIDTPLTQTRDSGQVGRTATDDPTTVSD
jgi:integrase